jgi:hypothetical protein
MISKNVSFSVVLAVLLSAPVVAFMPSNRPSHVAAKKSSLSMSAALIVQNKGGGHGELGTFLPHNYPMPFPYWQHYQFSHVLSSRRISARKEPSVQL